jgi:hypothetical protein
MWNGPDLLHSDHDTGVLIPSQQRIIAVLRARFSNICSACHEILMQVRACKATRYSCVHRFHDFEVGREQDVEIALVDLSLN